MLSLPKHLSTPSAECHGTAGSGFGRSHRDPAGASTGSAWQPGAPCRCSGGSVAEPLQSSGYSQL